MMDKEEQKEIASDYMILHDKYKKIDSVEDKK
jgi:hypothetical protein